MDFLQKLVWNVFYRPRILERVSAGCFDTWAEIQTKGSPRRKIVTLFYRLIYLVMQKTQIGTFSKFCTGKQTFAQHYQDLMVLYFSSTGTFIEIGASDGITDNNTYLLENCGWSGICFEPNIDFWQLLTKNRKCLLDSRAVYSKTDQIVRFSVDHTATFSGVISSSQKKSISLKMNTTREIRNVRTICLNDIFSLLNSNNVTYLSLDVEGTELEILEVFNFDEYQINMISVEHNGELKKSYHLNKLLRKKGYKRIFKYLSGPDFFYILKAVK